MAGSTNSNVVDIRSGGILGDDMRSPHVLIVDDEGVARKILTKVAESIDELPVKVVVRENVESALEWLKHETPDLIVTDFMMPGANGDSLVRAVREMPNLSTIPIVMITASDDPSVRQASLESGVTAFLRRPIDIITCKIQLRNLLNMRKQSLIIQNRLSFLFRDNRAREEIIKDRENQVVDVLINTMMIRTTNDFEHIRRISLLTEEMAKYLGYSERDYRTLGRVAPLCDYGAIGLPDAILNKADELTRLEHQQMETHTTIGAEILSNIRSNALQVASILAKHHHECWDGTGYPDQLAGEDIPQQARIVAVADVFSALLSERLYRPRWQAARALAYIQKNSGKMFDPECVEALIEVVSRDTEVAGSG